MTVVTARIRAASAILATVATATLVLGSVPAHAAAEPVKPETCAATDDAAAAAAAARKTERKHMMLGFAKTMASSMLPFGGLGHGGVGAVASALGQAATQAAANSAQASTRDRVAQVAATAPQDCAA